MKLDLRFRRRLDWVAGVFTLTLCVFITSALVLPATLRAEVFALDDGVAETAGGTPGGDLLALNHFDTGGRTVVVDQISVGWNPLSAAVSPTVVLYSDPDGDGNPSDASPLIIFPIYIPPNVVILGDTSLKDYSIPATVVSGSFFVGAYFSDRDSGWDPVIGVDKSHPQPNQSWIIENSSVGGLDLEAPAASSTLVTPLNTFINGNHLIRARYTVVPSCVQPPLGLVSWWRAEGNGNETAGATNHAVLLNGTSFTNGAVGLGFQMDGLDDAITVSSSPTLNFGAGRDFSIEAWIQPQSSITDSGVMTIVDKRQAPNLNQGLGYELSLVNGQIHCRLSDSLADAGNEYGPAGPDLRDGQFHHVAMTVTRNSPTGGHLYVDGQIVLTFDPTLEPGDLSNTEPLRIGVPSTAGVFSFFKGVIDEVSIYNRALATGEIETIFAAVSTGKCVPPPGGPPIILAQPEDQIKRPGNIATLAVLASGAPPLHYQWHFSGSALTDATNAAITLTSAQPAQAGPYFVTVTNIHGAATSSVAQLQVTPLPPASCLTVPTGAVAWWRAESNTVDSIGINDLLNPNGELLVAPSFMAGKVGNAFRFRTKGGFRPPYATNYLFAPVSADLDLGRGKGLTVEGWIKPDLLSGRQPLVEWNDGHGNVGAGLFLNGSALEGYLTDTNAPAIRRIVMRSPPGIVVTSAWQHVALAFDKSNGLATLLLNGVRIAMTNLGKFTPHTRSGLFLAHRPSGVFSSSLYFGGMDEFTLYSRALGPEEIQAVIGAEEAGKCAPPPPSCVLPPSDFVAWWRGESNTLDSVGSNNGVSLPTLYYATGVVGKAFQFDSGYVRIPASSNLNVGTGPGLTVEAWILPEVSSGFLSLQSRQFVGWHSGNATQAVSLSVVRLPSRFSSPSWQAKLVDTMGLAHVIQSPPGLVTPGNWQHVAFTYDKALGTASIYYNGHLAAQTNMGAFTPKTSTDLYLGYPTSSAPIPWPGGFSGAMDEVSLYARALSGAEIRAIMLSRNAGKCKEPPVIVSHPAGARINEGADVRFEVVATGNPILKYQWRRNSTNLPGATATSLMLTNVQHNDGGIYSVRVTNAFGAVVSFNAALTVNRPPVADPTATRLLVIAPMSCAAKVVLNASRSSDPEDDALQYFWFEGSATTAIATGAVAVATLPAGTHSIKLVVDDGIARDQQTFTVQVITAAQAVQQLLARVAAEVTKPHPLIASLSAALASIERGNATASINQLEALQNKVRAQPMPADPALAGQIIQAAQDIIDTLMNDCTRIRPPGKIGKVHRVASGKVRIQFPAPRGGVCIVEASTNLVDWEKIAVATESGPDELELEDSQAAQLPVRFYRIVSP